MMRHVLTTFCVALLTGACTSSVERPGGNRANTASSGGDAAGGTQPATGGASAGSGGSISTPGAGGSPPAVTTLTVENPFACNASPEAPPARRVWRLNPAQYAASVSAALNGRPADASVLVPALPPELKVPLQPAGGKYSTESGVLSIGEAEFRAALPATWDSAQALVARAKPGSCWATDNSAACAGTVLADRGAILFRRPLTQEEKDHYVTKFATDAAAVAELGADGALALAFQSMLLAPQFLFRPEIGATTPVAGVAALTPFETATSMAYALTGAPPDQPLWDAATNGALGTPDQIKQQAQRLLSAPSSVNARNFVMEYFELPSIQAVPKAADMIMPGEVATCHYNRMHLIPQAQALVDSVYASNGSNGFIRSLFTTTDTFFDCSTAAVFGQTGGPQEGQPYMKAAAPAGQRSGFLTHPALMGALAKRDDTLPVRRGKFVNTEILCRGVPAVPIEGVPPLGDTTTLTMRERLAVHAQANTSCKPCHANLDDAGLAFEIYDTVGTYRTMDKGKPIDGNGTLVDVGDASGKFKDAVELSALLGGSKRVEQCVMVNGFQYFSGRSATAFDSCSLKKAQDAYVPAGSYLEFVAELVASDSFLKRSY